MTMQQLHYILTIAQEGSLNKAAEQLFVSQPSLTSALKELENEIGIIIFNRTSRGVVPTPDGAEFLNRARQLYHQFELLTEQYESPDKIKRKFSVSTQHYSFAVEAFVNTVREYGTSGFDFTILETQTREVIRNVAESASEIGILYLSDHNRQFLTRLLKKNELEYTKLIDANAYVYLYKEHPLAHEQEISFEQLSQYPCVSFEQGEESSTFLAEEILSEAEYPRMIHTADRATNLNLMKGLNAFTLCSGIISEDLNGSDYVAIPFKEDNDHKNATMSIGYITKKHSIRSEFAKNYIAQLKLYLGIKE